MENLRNAEKLVHEAAKSGATLIVLPEHFNIATSQKEIIKNAECEDGPTFQLLQKLSKELNIYIVGGGVPIKERESYDSKSFNVCRVCGPSGEVACTYAKTHLFEEVDFGNGIKISESEVTKPGHELATFEIGCNVLVSPAQFEYSEIGPKIWEVVNRARAIDNCMYVISAAPARKIQPTFQSYGHSIIVDPSGAILKQAGYDEEILQAELDICEVSRAKNKRNLLRRSDMYSLVYHPAKNTLNKL